MIQMKCQVLLSGMNNLAHLWLQTWKDKRLFDKDIWYAANSNHGNQTVYLVEFADFTY